MMNGKPNVIVFFTDQQRWDTAGYHGNPLHLTPNLDRLAKFGTTLYNSFTCQPVCGPARSCMQTGQYATRTGCYRNFIPLPNSAKTLGHFYKEAGYDTAYIGKWHLADTEPVPPEARTGYDDWLASNILEFTSEAYHTVLYNHDGEPVKLPGYRVDALTDAAIRYIAEPRDERFFLFLSFIEPHHQNHLDNYPAPDGYEENYTGRWCPPDLAALGGSSAQHLGGYCGMVKRLDEALGRLMDALKSLGLSDNTIVLFASDHGCHFKTRNSEYKRSCHESSIRTPAVLYGPGFIGGGTLTQLVSLIDLPPTLLDASGLPVPDSMQGRSIMPLVRKEAVEWQQEVLIQISETQVGRAIRTDRWKYSVSAADANGMDDASAGCYTEEFLYDLHADPYELVNLVGFSAYSEIKASLSRRLIARMVAAGESEPVILTFPETVGSQRQVSLKHLQGENRS